MVTLHEKRSGPSLVAVLSQFTARARSVEQFSMANCDILSFDMCTLESFQESLFFFKTESGVTFSQKVESTPNAGYLLNASIFGSFFQSRLLLLNCLFCVHFSIHPSPWLRLLRLPGSPSSHAIAGTAAVACPRRGLFASEQGWCE